VVKQLFPSSPLLLLPLLLPQNIATQTPTSFLPLHSSLQAHIPSTRSTQLTLSICHSPSLLQSRKANPLPSPLSALPLTCTRLFSSPSSNSTTTPPRLFSLLHTSTFNPRHLPKPLPRQTFNFRFSSTTTTSVNTSAKMATIKLNTGHAMPQVGFGLWKVDNATCADTVYNAIKVGYRLFDGACGM